MRRILSLFLWITMSCLILFQGELEAQSNLSTSPYIENFDAIGSGLPTGFTIYTGSSSSALGAIATLNTAKVNWNNTAGGFKNFASATGQQSNTDPTIQGNSTDRALGLRQTGSLGDPGGAFVFQIANTTNRSGFKLSFDLQSLDVSSPRSVSWKVQYAVGANPSTFTDAPNITDSSTHTTMTTGGNLFFNDYIAVDFGNTLDNVNDIVTFRIVTLSASTGNGNRPSTALDNFMLSWTDIDNNAPLLGITDKDDHNISNLSFPSTSMGTPSGASFILTGKNLTDPVQLSLSSTYYKISKDSVNFVPSLSLPAADALSKKLYIKFDPTVAGLLTDNLIIASTGATDAQLSLSGTGVDPNITNYTFNTCGNNDQPADGFTQYSVIGDYQTWICTTFGMDNTNGINMNGYSGGNVDNEDWLISPKITKTFDHIPVMRFYSRGEFNGPALQLLVSTDYDGISNPENATWTDMKAAFPSLDDTWALTDGINLSDYKGKPFYFAFKYISSQAAGAARWTLDNISITDQITLFSVKPLLNNFGDVAVGTHTGGLPVLLQSIGHGDIHIAAPTNFELSTDSAVYTTSIDIAASAAQTGTKFYVRFSPAEEKLLIKDSLHITSVDGLASNTVILSGSSIPKAATLNVAAYNLSFFASSGSSAIVRTADQINEQIDNIATVMEHLGADIIAFEEMSSESGLNLMLSKVNAATGKNYKSSVSEYWSHKELLDPTYPAQKIGFIYDASRVDLSPDEPARAMFGDSTAGGYGYANGGGVYGSSFWSSGRLPYMATFIANINGKKQKLRMVVIHGKAGGDADSYQRRISDLQVLHDSLNAAAYTNDNIMIMGDFNDRLSTSINIGAPSSYQVFVDDNQYQKLTYTLDTLGLTSFPGDQGMIDNMLFRMSPQASLAMAPSESVFAGPSIIWSMAASAEGVVYLDSSATIEDPRLYISDYNKVVGSDHLPIYSRFEITIDDVTLPVTFIGDISAKQSQSIVNITWTTATELNSQYFVIEHSIDGVHFSPVGQVSSKATGTNGQSYLFSDPTPVVGVNYYRIRQVDVNGHFSYSKVASVNFVSGSDVSYRLYPNPVQNKLTIELAATDQKALTVSLINTAGSLILRTKGDLSMINQAINKKLPSLTTGVYFVDLVSGSKHYRLKFLKK